MFNKKLLSAPQPQNTNTHRHTHTHTHTHKHTHTQKFFFACRKTQYDALKPETYQAEQKEEKKSKKSQKNYEFYYFFKRFMQSREEHKNMFSLKLLKIRSLSREKLSRNQLGRIKFLSETKTKQRKYTN